VIKEEHTQMPNPNLQRQEEKVEELGGLPQARTTIGEDESRGAQGASSFHLVL
jgi:hypothetical protein